MSSLAHIIAKHTEGIPAVHLDYSDEIPNAKAIAADLGDEEVRELLSHIERLSEEREVADSLGTANGDDLDYMWRKFARYASLLPHLTSRFPSVIASGLSSRRLELRLYVAQAFAEEPVAEVTAPIEAQLQEEAPGPVRTLLETALKNCQKKKSWIQRIRS